ncbi:hypothetical protein SAMD00019534_071680, partial [Acytostelium subglobosum LB1]|uniref:hypothetical protein n=1 Tax=Acytostelium subglobosum LB1 TaxID=1410327 RepID=UPI0006450928
IKQLDLTYLFVTTDSYMRRAVQRPHANKNDIYLSTNGKFIYYVKRAKKLLLLQGAKEISIHGLGAAIMPAIKLSLYLQRHVDGLVLSPSTTTEEILDHYDPNVEYLDSVTKIRHCSAIHIKLIKRATATSTATTSSTTTTTTTAAAASATTTSATTSATSASATATGAGTWTLGLVDLHLSVLLVTLSLDIELALDLWTLGLLANQSTAGLALLLLLGALLSSPLHWHVILLVGLQSVVLLLACALDSRSGLLLPVLVCVLVGLADVDQHTGFVPHQVLLL